MGKYIGIYAVIIPMLILGYIAGSYLGLTTTVIGITATIVASLIAGLFFGKDKNRKPNIRELAIFSIATALVHALALFPIIYVAAQMKMIYFYGMNEMIKMSIQFFIVSIVINAIVFYFSARSKN